MGDSFLLMKRGLFYRPDNQGYTGVKELAGRYAESDASPDHGVTAIHESEAPMFAPACWNDIKVEVLLAKIATLKGALEFYANPHSWSVDGTFGPASPNSDFRPDAGDTARAALAKANLS